MGLRSKLMLPVLMAFLVMGSLLYWYWIPQYLSGEREHWKQHQQQIITAIEPFLLRDILAGDLAALHVTLNRQLTENHIDWRELEVLNEAGERLYPLSPPEKFDDSHIIHLSHKLIWQGRDLGQINLVVDYANEFAKKQSSVNQLSLIGLLVLGVFVVLATFWQTLWISIPIKRLEKAALSLAEGDASVPLPVAGTDELGHLTGTFAIMRDRLQVAMDEVQSSEKRYRTLLESAVDGMIIFDQEGVIDTINYAAEKMFGYEEDDDAEYTMSVLVPNFAIGVAGEQLDKLFDEEKIIQLSGVRKDGETFLLEMVVSLFISNDCYYYFAVLRDISKRVEHESELKKANSLLESLVQNLQAGLLVENDSRKVVEVNKLFCEMFNVEGSSEALVGSSASNSFQNSGLAFKDMQHFYESTERCMAWREVVAGEELVLADGRVFERDYIPVRLEDDEGYVHFWCYRDITGRKRIEEAVKLQSEQLEQATTEERALSNLLHLSLQSTDLDTFLDEAFNESSATEAWLKSLNLIGVALYLTEDMGNGDVLALSAKQDMPGNLLETHEQVLFGEGLCGLAASERLMQSCNDICNLPLIQDDVVLGVLSVHLACDDELCESKNVFLNRVADVLGMGISRRYANIILRQATLQAEAAVVAKNAFLATMSHEIRTPMNGVLGMVQVLANTDLNEMQRQSLETITESGKSLMVVINDILDFSKIEAGKLDLDPIDFNLHRTVNEVRELLHGANKNKDLKFVVDYATDCPVMFSGDAGRIRQIILNLMGNAAKFTTHGHVTIEVSCLSESINQAKLKVAVKDTGIGISAQAQKTLFESFTQADGSTTRRFGGTGLGLSICKQLIELMGGEIDVDSEPGEGSVFWFILELPIVARQIVAPLNNVPDQEDSVNSQQLPQFRGRVLLAEDVEFNQMVACSMLSQFGIDVDVASDGEQAVAAWRDGSYDLILMDCQMPLMDGYQATEAIRQQEQQRGQGRIPVVALTANAMKSDRDKCLESGMDDFLSKPVEMEMLGKILGKSLQSLHQQDDVSSESVVATRQMASVDKSLVDQDKLDSMRKMMGPKIFEQLVPVFMDSTEKLLDDLLHASEQSDSSQVHLLAHSIKSASANVGAMRLSDLASALEGKARQSDLDEASQSIRQLREMFEDVCDVLKQA